MLELLAQISTPASQPDVPPFDFSVWAPLGPDLLRAGIAVAAALVVGIPIFLVIRRRVRSLKLATAYGVTLATVALFAGTQAYEVGHEIKPGDPIRYWIARAFAAAMTFVLLRLIDRVLIVPILTRGGRVAIPRFFHQMVNILQALFAALIFGSLAFGWDIDRFLAGSAVVSIVLGLALQETLGNFFSGLVMQASPPFEIGHRIKCGSFEGDVVDMTWRAVTLHTDEDDYVIIPNGTVAKTEILNYSKPTRATARFVRVGLEYDLPPADALAVLRSAALETEEVLQDPAPVIFLEEFGDSAVTYGIKFWITNAKEHEIIQHRLRVHIWYRLRERGYNIPFPIRTVEHSSHAAKNRQAQELARGRRLDAIGQVPLLDPLTPAQKRALADSANEVYLAAGQVLFRQNDTGDSFYIIYKGAVEVLVTVEGAGGQRTVATLGAGEFFGEMSALTGQPRTATIRATAPLACVQIEKQDLLAIFQHDPAIMETISQIVAQRNAQREAILQHTGAAAAPEAVARQQKNVLQRMMSFFRIGQAA